MARQMIMSVLTLYNYRNTLFNKMAFPDGFTAQLKELTINNILSECAELDIIYPDWDFLNTMIGTWSNIEKPTWDRMYKLSELEYNPIENYNRTEIETVADDRTEQHSGIDSNQTTGIDTRTTTGNNTEGHSGSDTTETDKYAYDASTPKPETIGQVNFGERITNNHSTTDSFNHGTSNMITHGEKIKHDGTVDRESHIYGNIGVTTSAQMIEGELALAPKLNIIKYITQSFKERFCLLIY